MTKTYLLSNIQDAVAIATKLTHSWFRGHSRVIGTLTPRIYRPNIRDEIVDEFRPAMEVEIIENFKGDAPTLAEGPVPGEDDHLGWLYLMQHYKTPTRLLDWSENALIALYFAVVEDKHDDGELWCMFPLPLNRASHIGWGTPIIGRNPVLRYLTEEPYWAGTSEELAASMDMTVVPNRPVALDPRRNFRRMVTQASVFTIHPRPEDGHTIPELLSDETALVRYMVPADAKNRLRADLDALGIGDLSLFPDLEGLSRQVIFDNRVIAYSPPSPPQCSGVWQAEGNDSDSNAAEPTPQVDGGPDE